MIIKLMVLLQTYFLARTITVLNEAGKKIYRACYSKNNGSKNRDRIKKEIRGFLFDVDGTLYHQLPFRILMAMAIVACHLDKPGRLPTTLKVIRCYRKAQEKIRNDQPFVESPAAVQIQEAARKCGVSSATVQAIVDEWIERRPLAILHFCRRKGLVATLNRLAAKGYVLGVYSDYPACRKLKALGIAHFFPVVVSGSDAGVRGFKPHSNGFQIAAAKMGLKPEEILYVGDRSDSDGNGAEASGMRFVIIGKSTYNTQNRFIRIERLKNIEQLFMGCVDQTANLSISNGKNS